MAHFSPLAYLVSVVVLWGSTLGIISLDKSMRANRQSSSDTPDFTEEPGWGILVLLTILCNIGALPYYFGATRKSALWGFLGFLAFLGCATLMVIVRVVVSAVVH